MINIPVSALHKKIVPGAVLKFKLDGFTSDLPHYFIILNHNPITDSFILLACCSSKVERTKHINRSADSCTLVDIPANYFDFITEPTIINCNSTLEVKLSEIERKFNSNQLHLENEVPITFLNKLRTGVLKSDLVSRKHQKILIIDNSI